MLKLVIASKNLHKIREIKSVLKSIKGLDVLSLMDFPEYVAPEESGTTFEENARIKAIDAAKAIGELVLADDSGLVVPALDNAPGVYSARYAGPDATDKDNRHKLLKAMQHLPDNERKAHYICCMVLASSEGVLKVATGLCEGEIITTEKGSQGFGYDSIFVKDDYGKTFAQIDETTKMMICHRRKALDKIMLPLEAMVLRHAPIY